MVIGKVVRVVDTQDEETARVRLITVRSEENPWPGNPYEDYTFRDDTAEFKFGDAVLIRLDAK